MESEIWGWPPFESLVFQDGVIGFWRLAVFVVSFLGLQGPASACLGWTANCLSTAGPKVVTYLEVLG